MRTIIILPIAAAGAEIPCPSGHRIRIIAVSATVSISAEAEQIIVTFAQSPTPLFRAVTQPLTPGVGSFESFVGATSTDGVQGVFTPEFAVAALPDMWWDFAVRISVTASGASSVTSVPIVTYELEVPFIRRLTQRQPRERKKRSRA